MAFSCKEEEGTLAWMARLNHLSFPAKTLANRWVVAKRQKPSRHQIRRWKTMLFPSVFIKMKMRRFIRLSVKEMRLYSGNAQCENIQCFPTIQMATLHYEQCMAQRTTRHNLTSEYKKSLPSMKECAIPGVLFVSQ